MFDENRSKIMSKIRGTDTKIEVKLRHELYKRGIRYRKNVKDIYGRPDIAIKKYKIAIFCDGDFWHGYDWENRRNSIKTNIEFWTRKIERNIEKDVEVNHVLKYMGYTVIRVWEHEIDNNVEAIADMIEQEIKSKKDFKIETATMKDFNECLNLYSRVCYEMRNTDHDIMWNIGTHPSIEEIAQRIEQQELFIVNDKSKIIASVVLNHEGTVNYDKANWNVDTTNEKVLVLHLLAVDPNYRGIGLAKKLVLFALEKASKDGMEAFRLDAIKYNTPAINLYKSLGLFPVDEHTEKINAKEISFILMEKRVKPLHLNNSVIDASH